VVLRRLPQTELSQNDHIYLSHYHDPEEGYPNLEQSSDWLQDEHDSIPSVIHRSAPSILSSTRSSHCFPIEHIQTIARLAQDVIITAESQAYLHNLVVFLRLNRAVRTGASPTATIHFELLSRYGLLSHLETSNSLMPTESLAVFMAILLQRPLSSGLHFARYIGIGSRLPQRTLSVLGSTGVI